VADFVADEASSACNGSKDERVALELLERIEKEVGK